MSYFAFDGFLQKKDLAIYTFNYAHGIINNSTCRKRCGLNHCHRRKAKVHCFGRPAIDMSKKEIRQLQGFELEEALALVWEVFSQFEAPGYSDEGIEEFWRFIDLEYMVMRTGEGSMTFWGAFEDDYLVGVCAFRGFNHISLLFVDPEYHRRGIATALVKKAVSDCKRIDESVDSITVNSSEYALPFYTAIGFEKTGELTEDNGIKYIPMKIEAK